MNPDGNMRRVAHALLVALLLLASPYALAEETIERWLSTIEVQADGDLLVIESITVRAEGRRIRRGIYRDFPLQFEDDQGRLRSVSFELVAVTRDGRAEPHFTRSSARGVRIYAGDENRLLEPGVYRYELRYRTGRQIRFVDGRAELYWNVTGNEWAFPIASARALVRLPGDAAPVRWTGYTGRFGERGADFRARLRDDGQLEFETTRRLSPGEGLTLVAELPQGAVAPPSQAQQLHYAFLDNRRYVLSGLGLLVVAAFYLIVWRAVGRDPPKGTIIPLFHPPEGISPALAGYIREWGWSGAWREFTAAAVSLAVKGLVQFDDSGGGLILKRAGPPVPGPQARPEYHALPPGERTLLSWIDGSGGVAFVDRANGESLAKAFASFKASIEKENRHRFFKRNLGWFGAGVFLTGLAIGAVLVFGQLREAEIGLLIGSAVGGAFVGVFVVQAVRALLGGSRLRVVIASAIHLTALAYMATMFVTQVAGPDGPLSASFRQTLLEGIADNAFPLVLVGGFAALNGLFYYLLRAPTAAGRPVMDQIEGLELYLRTAETERLNLQGAPEITAERFERLLPYAIALDAEKPWSEAFEAAFARAHPGQDVSASYRPGWRTGPSWSGRGFARAMTGAVAAAQGAFASAMPAPKSSSSGFSGGGGSGGGGGGGGGGGW
ncbi:DUF2207 domain-containing protein [Burkholderiaceae bacterium FT117]|uniref:DUF2207 domain-containing protein n=1 Tax=Zeimonas sediminis TaxID=2944268 RepID=UPI002342EA27|nr:DUF2207 domain-containing protein [Zeimonas sediminis]MCM5571122.1 DUF2207 domain-containing protein [Zeimonas sediminis]